MQSQLQARQQSGFDFLASAIPLTGVDFRRVIFQGEQCPQSQSIGFCQDAEPFPAGSTTSPVTVYPTGYRVWDECTTLNGPIDQNRIQRLADAVLSYQLAHELWTGEGTQSEKTDNPYLDAGATTVTGGDSVAEKLGLLEMTAKQRSKGQPVFLHLPIRHVLALGDKLSRVGNTLQTPIGSTVIADSGYTGSHEGVAGDWAYATGPVGYAASESILIDDDQSTVDRQHNRRTVNAFRGIAVVFDPCCHYGVDLAATPSN